jgi:NhaA family Na+:H+ antiporter
MARRIGRPMRRFLHVEAAGGLVLLAATIAALVWANVAGDSYTDFWHSEIGLDVAGFELSEDLLHWVNDLLMAVFFFVVGLEIKREWEVGELVDRRAALLPAVGAIGGMVAPRSSSLRSTPVVRTSMAGGYRWRPTSPLPLGSSRCSGIGSLAH